jgi:hypothetical protein
MLMSERKLPSGVAVLQVGDWSVEDVNVFVDGVECLVHDEPIVRPRRRRCAARAPVRRSGIGPAGADARKERGVLAACCLSRL